MINEKASQLMILVFDLAGHEQPCRCLEELPPVLVIPNDATEDLAPGLKVLLRQGVVRGWAEGDNGF